MAGLRDLFIQKRGVILERWLSLILATYPSDTSGLMGREKDPFVNPVGYTITKEIESLYEGLIQGKGPDQLSGPLEKLLQIRSVQDFSPSQAVVVVLLLKKALQEEMERNRPENPQVMEEWLEFESKIDRLILLAFDIYTRYRERIYEIRINEIKKERDRVLRLLERTHSAEKRRDSKSSSE